MGAEKYLRRRHARDGLSGARGGSCAGVGVGGGAHAQGVPGRVARKELLHRCLVWLHEQRGHLIERDGRSGGVGLGCARGDGTLPLEVGDPVLVDVVAVADERHSIVNGGALPGRLVADLFPVEALPLEIHSPVDETVGGRVDMFADGGDTGDALPVRLSVSGGGSPGLIRCESLFN